MTPTLALPIIMLRNKANNLTHQEALYAAVYHMSNIVQTHSLKDAQWIAAYGQWDNGPFRKIVKRTTSNKFRSLAAMDDALYTNTTLPLSAANVQSITSEDQKGTEAGKAVPRMVEFVSTSPRDIADRDARIDSMQVSGLEHPLGKDIESSDSRLFIAVNGALGASTGKLIAQVSHAIQIALKGPQKDLVQEELSKGLSIYGSFENMPANATMLAEVRDAGFTEIPPNSLTAFCGITMNKEN